MENMEKSGENEKNCSGQGKVKKIHFCQSEVLKFLKFFWGPVPRAL